MPEERLGVDPVSSDAHLGGRAVLTGVLVLLFVMGIVQPGRGLPTIFFGLAVLLLVATGAATMSVSRMDAGLYRRVTWAALPFDLLALGLLTVVLHDSEDAMYPLLLGLALAYSAISRRKNGWLAVSGGAAAVHIGAHVVNGVHGPAAVSFLLLDSGILVFFSYVVASSLRRQTRREAEIRRTRDEVRHLNEDMERRLTELQAVSQISEVIHSTLDFDSVGPVVIDIIQKVMDIPAASLFVIDKPHAETLFSATRAGSSAMYSPSSGVTQILDGEDIHFSCLSILDREDVMVVFCAAAESLQAMHPEDKLVLQTIAAELVVAVENSRLYKLTKRMAITDELTGLYNYRYLQQRLDEEVERAKRYEKHLSLLMLDVDGFKRFNDTHGHISGDRALAALGRVIRATVREVDVVARYGGEEFSVLLPETDEPGAYVVAEKVREAIAMHRFMEGDAQPAELTVSIGLATLPLNASDKEGLLQQADEALYQAKHFGKNRVRAPRKEPFMEAEGLAEGAL